MKVIVAGAGAFGKKHLDGIRNIEGVEVVGLIGRRRQQTQEIADKYGIADVFTDFDEALKLPGLNAAILCTPTQMHAAQAIKCMQAGIHVQVEIPLADNWRDALSVMEAQRDSRLVCMVGHTRRFNPSHQYLHKRISAGELAIQQLDVQTYFFRRKNINAAGEPRSW
ncbi:MAG: Gfo/Idh/MocA family oxidoreductase, partial [Pseudomonadota bacterium]|nr:Gfo/Idh/MocA family oxidoreductase [Pseudomonadota bacterium]